jgi:hypothetical protein
MSIRLVVAMLMLVGPLPARVCTCAAAEVHDLGESDSPTADLPDEDGHCGHSHGKHRPDCPAVNPQVAAPDAVSPSASVTASDLVPDAPSPIPSLVWTVVTPVVPAAPGPTARRLPLYITFRSLRN